MLFGGLIPMTVDPNILKGNLDLILLTLFAEGPKYGLEVIKEAQERTAGYFEFKEGSLYPALHRLEKAKLLEGYFGESDVGGPRRRYYRLTKKGKQVLATKQSEWERFVRAMEELAG